MVLASSSKNKLARGILLWVADILILALNLLTGLHDLVIPHAGMNGQNVDTFVFHVHVYISYYI